MPGPMGGPGGAGRSIEKAKDFKGTTKKLIKNYLSKYKINSMVFCICKSRIGLSPRENPGRKRFGLFLYRPKLRWNRS